MPDISDAEAINYISKCLIDFLSNEKRENDYLEMAKEVVKENNSIRQAPIRINRNNGETYLLKISVERLDKEQ